MLGRVTEWKEGLFKEVPIYSLVLLRVAFGLILLWEVYRYLNYDWIERYWINVNFNFTYWPFHWVTPWPGEGMYIHFYVMGVLAFMLMVGFLYRFAAVLVFFGFSYIYLLEQARYLNHFYLVMLISFLMIFIPAHRYFSVDSRIWPKLKSEWIPRWGLWLLQFQMGVVYIFGALAKVNGDWLRGEPLRHWLMNSYDIPILGELFKLEPTIYLMSYSGLLIDLLAPLFLIYRKTRPFMFAALVSFHFLNDRMFTIGIFPWFAILSSTIFFEPDWPKRFWRMLTTGKPHKKMLLILSMSIAAIGSYVLRSRTELVPLIVAALGIGILCWTVLDLFSDEPKSTSEGVVVSTKWKPAILALVGFWIVFQVGMPIRHYFIPGNTSWTESGHRYAWHMKLRNKEALVRFFGVNPDTGERMELKNNRILASWQHRKMANRPYMIQQYAKHLKSILEKAGYNGYEIRAESLVSLNFRPYQLMIDPDVDLAKVTWTEFGSNDWVLPLEHPHVSGTKYEPPRPHF